MDKNEKCIKGAIKDGIKASSILNSGLFSAMEDIGNKFKNNECYCFRDDDC